MSYRIRNNRDPRELQELINALEEDKKRGWDQAGLTIDSLLPLVRTALDLTRNNWKEPFKVAGNRAEVTIGGGDVLISSVRWSDGAHGVSFAHLPIEAVGSKVGDNLTGIIQGETCEDVNALIAIRSFNPAALRTLISVLNNTLTDLELENSSDE